MRENQHRCVEYRIGSASSRFGAARIRVGIRSTVVRFWLKSRGQRLDFAASGMRKTVRSARGKDLFAIDFEIPAKGYPEAAIDFALNNKLPGWGGIPVLGREIFENWWTAEVVPPIDGEESEFNEGTPTLVLVNRYERDRKAREECLRVYGFACSVCDLSFETQYGARGKGFIHVHHLLPLYKIKKNYKVDPIKDLRPVCPNCHAMLHKTGMELAELKADFLKRHPK